MKIFELLDKTPFTLIQGNPEAEVKGISHDNRKVKEGDIFVCVRGSHFDTHDVIEDAVSKGASLLIIEKDVPLPEGVAAIKVDSSRAAVSYIAASFYGMPAEKLNIIAITGSKGKTTATHMMAAILREAGYRTGTIGTNGAVYPLTEEALKIPGAERYHYVDCEETPGHAYYELHNTTPEPTELQMHLSMMVASGCTHLVMEVSSQAIKQNRVDGMVFDHGIWTNLATGDHIGGAEHETFDDYAWCKAQVLNMSKLRYVNLDDPYYEDFVKYINKLTIPYGESEEAVYRAQEIQNVYDEETRSPGVAFKVSGLCSGYFMINMPGEFNVYNALSCIAVANQIEIPPEPIKKALANLKIRARYNPTYDGKFRVFVDYAHNGYSTINHLEGLKEYRPNRIICVYSADGSRDRSRRWEMGEICAEMADISIVSEGHSRYESFESIRDDILIGIAKGEEKIGRPSTYEVIQDRVAAIRRAIDLAEEGDIVTIIGVGGHKSYLDINGVEEPHSDIETVREYIKELGI